MPAEIVTGRFCASWFSDFYVPSSSSQAIYKVSMGGTSHVHCTCPAFRHFRGAEYDRTCKHIAEVFAGACLWNEQWRSGPESGEITCWPIEGSCDYQMVPGESCPTCGGPVCPVKIAV